MPVRLPLIRRSWLGLLAALALAGCDTSATPEAGRAPAPPLDAAEAATGPAPDTLDLRQLGYGRGAPDAPVTVIEFSDFGCPYCGVFALQTYPELAREFVETGQVRWQFVPMVLGIFPNGDAAARAAECAGEQDGFWPMHDLLFQTQREWKGSGDPLSLFTGYAQRLQLDAERFASCYREDRGRERIRLNNHVAELAGIRATPTFLVEGRMVEGALPAEQFRMLLRQVTAGR